MNDTERDIIISRLEDRYTQLKERVEKIEYEQETSKKRHEKASLEAMDLSNKLSALIQSLEDHKKLHEKQGETKYKVTDIVLALGMLGIAALQLFRG